MLRHVLGLTTMLAVTASWGGEGPQVSRPCLLVEPQVVELPEAHQLTEVAAEVEVSNTCGFALPVQVVPLREDGSGTVGMTVLAPGERTTAVLRQPVGLKLGAASFRFGITSADPARPSAKVTLSTFVQSAYDPEAQRLDFGTVDRSLGASRTAVVASREVPALAITGAEALPPFMTLHVGVSDLGQPQSVPVTLTIDRGAPEGLHRGVVVLRTNVPSQPRAPLIVVANVFGDIVPARHPVDFGIVERGRPAVAEVELRSRSGRPVRIAAASAPEGDVETELRQCETGEPSCLLLVCRTTPQIDRAIHALVELHVEGVDDPVPITLVGVVVDDLARVRSLGVIDGATELHLEGAESAGSRP